GTTRSMARHHPPTIRSERLRVGLFVRGQERAPEPILLTQRAGRRSGSFFFFKQKTAYEIGDLIRFGTLSVEAAAFLQACVRARANLLIAGGSSSGKTTLLNGLASCIAGDERIVSIEEAAELRLQQDHVCRLESLP